MFVPYHRPLGWWVWVFAVLLGTLPWPAGAALVVELPPLGWGGSGPDEVSSAGTVIGRSFVYPLYPAHTHAFTYVGGVLTDLGTLPGEGNPMEPFESGATGINNAGVVVGFSSYNPEDALFHHAVRWTDGQIADLDTLGGPNSGARAINNAGTIVGVSATTIGETHGFVYTDAAGMVDLGVWPTSDWSIAEDINDAGMIVGSAALEHTPTTAANACVWIGDHMIDLGNLGGREPQSAAHAVNGAGLVVGESTVVGSGAYHAFAWTQETGMVDLGVLYDGSSSFAADVNSRDDIVGWHRMPGGFDHASMFSHGRWIDLHAAYFPNWLSTNAAAINDAGWIVGSGIKSTGEAAGWLLMVPEPATTWLLAIGGTALLWWSAQVGRVARPG